MMKISLSTLAKYRARLDRLIQEMQEESRFEIEHNVDVVDTGLLLAYRPWQYSYMGAIKKKEKVELDF